MASKKQPGGVRAAFMANEDGKVCIVFNDPAYVRSDMILLDPADLSIHAVLHESSHFVGHLSSEMADIFVNNQEVLLAAVHTKGYVVDLVSPLSITRI